MTLKVCADQPKTQVMKSRNRSSLVLLLLGLAGWPVAAVWAAETATPAASASTAAASTSGPAASTPAANAAAPAAASAAAGDSGDPRTGEVALPFKRSARKPIGASLPPLNPAPAQGATGTPPAAAPPSTSSAAAAAPAKSTEVETPKSAAKAAAPAKPAKPEAANASTASPKPAAEPSPKSGTAATAQQRQDPLDVLRDRLTQRLAARNEAGGKSSVSVNVAPTAPGEFQLKIQQAPSKSTAHSPAGHAGGRTSSKAASAAAHGANSANSANSSHSAHAHHWTYEGSAGPQAWGSLKPEFQTCDRGQRQSPIDIRGGLPLDLEPLQFDYRDGFFTVTDNGHTLDTKPAGGNSLVVGTRRFELQGVHFHRPAEERIDGKSFAMSVHMVHKDAQGRLAVVGLLVEEGPENPAVQTLWNHIPLERGETAVSAGAFNPASLLPSQRGYYTYMGSLTTPPCTEGVLWMVMQKPITLSAQQLATFARLYAHNARPIQPDRGRIIKQSR
jgi:carbonic anhydrase